ncbi:MAG TPA: TlpA disulfide reductase family protein [Pyrinomonadaceae bacterium]|nr:TlpA disulfide reductase family protein [Pyrinomonadaceae bacterium]
MRCFTFCLFTFAFLVASACRPAAAPVAVSNSPVSINNVPQTNAPLPPTKPIEEMYWAKLDGQTQKLKELQGKAVILDFWATYCPPCIQEIPHLKELQKKYGKENLEIVGLHVGGDEDRPKVPAFAERLKIDYPIATPEDQLIRFIFGNDDTIPQTAIFDRKGKMITKITGFSPEIKIELDSAVEKAVKTN